ncbi:hypothetical protein L208DRAFT_593481 [Tricholoma matsutake]|nr:hypothetical protein L208DRAFT_593481 [Tricholoma matsutake 945]
MPAPDSKQEVSDSPIAAMAPTVGGDPPKKETNVSNGDASKIARQDVSMSTHFLQVSMQYPCGFCAQSSLNGACSVRIQTGKAISTCSRAYDFKISPASKISKQKACTNVPIQCQISIGSTTCTDTFRNDTLLGKAMRPQSSMNSMKRSP